MTTDYTHTISAGEAHPWLDVLLPTRVRVTRVRIYNRADSNCASRMFLGTGCSWGTNAALFNAVDQGKVGVLGSAR